MPNRHSVGATRNIVDAEGPRPVGNGEKWRLNDRDEPEHPGMNIAAKTHDGKSVLGGEHYRRGLGWLGAIEEGLFPVGARIGVDIVQCPIFILDQDLLAGVCDQDMGEKLAAALLDDEVIGRRWFRPRDVKPNYGIS